MKLSIAVATNRSIYWVRFCEALAKNDTQVEVIFVGPVGVGVTDLAVPAWFINVPDPAVGAARCWEVGARAATGDLLGLAADDCVYSPGFLDALVKEASKPHHPYDMFSARYHVSGTDNTGQQRMWSMPEMPLVPVGGFAFAGPYHRLGGIDRRFHGVFWDSDLYMHMYQLGGRTTLLADHVCDEQNHEHVLYGANHGADQAVLHELWPAPLSPDMHRASPRERWGEL